MGEVKQLESILVKPAGPDCNMACTYCFYSSKLSMFGGKIHRMAPDVLENLIRQAMAQSHGHISFAWQGGEPTLMGLSFFKKVVEYEQRYAKQHVVGNGLQTNGILIDRNWARFLGEYNFLVGLSIDGPRHIHDRYRVMKNGKGSWSKVVDRAKLLIDTGVAVNAISVITDYSADFPEEVYEFNRDLGLRYMQFIPCVETDPISRDRAAPFSVSAVKYGKFLCRVFDLWMDDFRDNLPTTSIRFFESILFRYAGMEPPDCTLLEECGVYVVVEHTGDVYSCDFFVEPRWRLGNIAKDRLIDLLNSPRQLSFGKIKSRLPNVCRDCKWLDYCRGGCIKDRMRDPKDNGVNHFCESFKMFFEHADAKLKRLASRVQPS